jgi:hypothetical protein
VQRVTAFPDRERDIAFLDHHQINARIKVAAGGRYCLVRIERMLREFFAQFGVNRETAGERLLDGRNALPGRKRN